MRGKREFSQDSKITEENSVEELLEKKGSQEKLIQVLKNLK